jgi:hypothetical protein
MATIPFAFTRYLYVKDEVYYALLLSILAKDHDQSLFWACELYYSGFQDGIFKFLWTVYYDFYFTLNPSFENYLVCSYNDYTTSLIKDIAPIANVVINLCIRPFNTDVFILRHITKQIEIDTGILNNNNNTQFHNNKEAFTKWLAEQNYECIAQFILAECSPNDLRAILEETCNYFVRTGVDLRIPKILKTFDKLCSCSTSLIHSRDILLSRIIQFFTIQSGPPVKPKNIYLTINKDDLTPFQTLLCPAPNNYKTLRTVCKYSINASSLLGMFAVARPDNLAHLYHDHWTYWSAGSPYWAAAIRLYGGKLCRQSQSVVFATALQEEEFYQIYGLEPDEQPLNVQQRAIEEIGAAEVGVLYDQYKKFNVLATDKDYLDALERISYLD